MLFDKYRQFYAQPAAPSLARKFMSARLSVVLAHALGRCDAHRNACPSTATRCAPKNRRLGVQRCFDILRHATSLQRVTLSNG